MAPRAHAPASPPCYRYAIASVVTTYKMPEEETDTNGRCYVSYDLRDELHEKYAEFMMSTAAGLLEDHGMVDGPYAARAAAWTKQDLILPLRQLVLGMHQYQ